MYRRPVYSDVAFYNSYQPDTVKITDGATFKFDLKIKKYYTY